MTTQPRVVCLILNFHRPDDTLACLQSLAEGTYRNYQTLVLDVGSGEALAAPMRARFPEARYVPVTGNDGYAGNNNLGLRLAAEHAPDWVFLLNDDTRLAPDCLTELMAAATTHDRAGMLGPTVYHASQPDLVQSAGGQLSAAWEAKHLDENQPLSVPGGAPRPVTFLVGCALLARWATVEQIGGLDERFFMYYEEVDWCLRAGERGWERLQVPTARLWHKGVTPDYQPTPNVTYYSARNRLLLMAKHHAPFGARLRAWAEFSRTLVSWTLRPKWRNHRAHRAALGAALADAARGRTGARA